MLEQEVRGVSCKFRTHFPEIWLKKHDGRKREFIEKLRRRQDQGRILFILKDEGDPELHDILRERARGGPGWRQTR